MKGTDLATILSLPDDALLPVRLIREAVAGIQGTGCDGGLGLTVGEVAEETGRAASTVRTWAAEGRLPGAKRLRGREWRIPRSALHALLEEDDAPARASGAKRLEVPRGGLSAWRDAK
jgi:excisionase family DNA binding protein